MKWNRISHGRRWHRRHAVLAVLLVAAAALPAIAQRRGGRGGQNYGGGWEPNIPYDGRYTFVRVAYNREEYAGAPGPSNWVYWSHDYPRGETHFMKILKELSLLDPAREGSNILYLDDPELMRYPVAYMCEPGSWRPNDREIAGLKAYLQKGGFLLIDDFGDEQWYNFEGQVRRAFPDARFVPVDKSHPIFDSFFRIADPIGIFAGRQGAYRGVPEYLALYEDNDPTKRMLMMVNYRNDLSEYWEFSDEESFAPINQSNEAYKVGVNEIIYAMTH